jgi:spectinomycin phosphotransferase
VAAVPAANGETVLPIGERYAVAVFPFIGGNSGRFGGPLSAGERCQLVNMLAALHRSRLPGGQVPVARIGLPLRDGLDSALSELGQPWRGGPFAEPAREVLSGAAGQIRRLLADLDQLAGRAAVAPEPVITHGEPHPGNIIRAGRERLLIDWDTVGLAPPERDLWLAVTGAAAEARRYGAATGRSVDPVMLAFYRLRWALDDLSAFTHQLRSAHRRTAGARHAWRCLKQTVTSLPPA